MKIKVHFYSYFKDLTGCTQTEVLLPPGSRIADLLAELHRAHPRLLEMKRSTLIAVGVEYQAPEYLLKEGDEVSLFPPVQGG